ncbi:MAG TPA: sigma-70 family RNA polymerase sigma factor [Vicinamibacterales bacterium]|jgi:RNA polymerase sigma-70 factor (ECF subfamily)
MAEAGPIDFQALMIAANAGDAEAYSRLLRGLTPVIRRIVGADHHLVGTDAVEDVVQEVLLSVHSVRATYDPDRPFMPWLVAIVRRRTIDAARRRIRRGMHEVSFDRRAVTFPAAETNSYRDEVVHRDALRVAIARLPRGQRQAIDLLKLREMSLQEAAAATGSSVGALKVATHRAMTALRAMLNKT